MRVLKSWAGIVVATLALVIGVGSVRGQQDVHATMVPQESRKVAPAFQLPDASGANKQSGDYRGKVVVLNFWATACGGCKMEIPWFTDLETAHKGDSFSVVGVSMDTSYEGLTSADDAWKKVKPFVAEYKMNYPVLMGDSATLMSYGLKALPATFLIDKQGRIAATYFGVVSKSDVEANVVKLLGE